MPRASAMTFFSAPQLHTDHVGVRIHAELRRRKQPLRPLSQRVIRCRSDDRCRLALIDLERDEGPESTTIGVPGGSTSIKTRRAVRVCRIESLGRADDQGRIGDRPSHLIMTAHGVRGRG